MLKKLSPFGGKLRLAPLVLILFFTNSCKKENASDFEKLPDPSLSELQSWYKGNFKPAEQNQFSTLTPLWDRVYAKETPTEIVYEVQLQNPEHFFVSFENLDARHVRDQDVDKTEIRLLLFRSRKTKEIKYGAFLSVQNTGGMPNAGVHYRDVHDFSGNLLFYHINGSMSNGWRYSQGSWWRRSCS